MTIFKAYDIRGIYGSELDELFAERLGRIIISYTKAKKVIIGYDSRNSNLKLFSALSKGIMESGVNITHIGIVSRPMLNWVAIKHKYDLAIMVSASHNPKEYNGFKFLWKGKPLSYYNGLNDVEKLMKDKKKKFKIKKKMGKIASKDFIDEYVKFLSSKLTKRRLDKLRIVGDASNGAAGEIIKRFIEKNSIKSELLFIEPDGNFPCHNPNPLDDNALAILRKKVVEKKADFGFIVDPDADRIRFVDEKGNIIENSYMQSLIVKYLFKKSKKATIVHDLISRKILSDTIRRNKGKEIISKVGFANIIDNMAKNKAVYGCEISGHNYFKEMHYIDTALLMLVHVINLYLSSKKKMSSLIKPLDKYVDFGELNYKIKYDTDKVIIIDKIKENFVNKKNKYSVKKISELDGMSVVAKDFWLNIRPSNTEPLLRLRIEGRDKKKIEKVKKDLEKILIK